MKLALIARRALCREWLLFMRFAPVLAKYPDRLSSSESEYEAIHC